MGSAGRRHGHGIVTHFALTNHSLVTLQISAVNVVVHLLGGEFGVLRAVAGGAVKRAVPLAVTVEFEARDGNVLIGGKGLVRGSPPVVGTVKSGRIPEAVLVAHLASRFGQPTRASGLPDVSPPGSRRRAGEIA